MGDPHSGAKGALTADVVVVGAGLIGLAATLALADRGLRVLLVNDTRRGEASPAAAGMLAPTVEPATTGPALDFAIAARDRYPDYVAELRERTGIEVPLNRLGILRLALTEAEGAAMRAALPEGARWLSSSEVSELEPALVPAAGAAFHPEDGAVNNLVLMRALKHAIGHHGRVHVLGDAVTEIAFDGDDIRATTRDERRLAAGQMVLATGAWAPQLAGLERPLPIEPVRGQMMSVVSRAIRHVVYGGEGYVVPRADGRTLIGATMERVGFDPSFTEQGIAEVRAMGGAIAPSLGEARMLNAWAGLRPMTPDGLPVIGRDPEHPSLLYACGHSRNGVLMAPLTGDCVADLASGVTARQDLSAFAVGRFAP